MNLNWIDGLYEWTTDPPTEPGWYWVGWLPLDKATTPSRQLIRYWDGDWWRPSPEAAGSAAAYPYIAGPIPPPREP